MTQEPSVNETTRKKVWLLVDRYLELHRNETFDLDTICRHLNITERENRHFVVQKLSYEVGKGNLEKVNRIYRTIDNTLVTIDWVNASEAEVLDIHWPFGRDDQSQFSFDGNVRISPGDLIVIAGVSNMGKTTMCLNFLWENMDYYPCTLMGNEYQASKFKRRVSRMEWAEPINEHGAPKFELIERYEGWKDIIRPDNINIIDWIGLDDKFYMIGSILQGIKSKLRKGIAVVALQKDPNKPWGQGGGFSEHLASLYLLMDFEKLTIKKAKEWVNKNPNGMIDGFTITEAGSRFDYIRPIKKCPKCWGWSATKGVKCENCSGTGYVNA
jgi:hypothetical protein